MRQQCVAIWCLEANSRHHGAGPYAHLRYVRQDMRERAWPRPVHGLLSCCCSCYTLVTPALSSGVYSKTFAYLAHDQWTRLDVPHCCKNFTLRSPLRERIPAYREGSACCHGCGIRDYPIAPAVRSGSVAQNALRACYAGTRRAFVKFFMQHWGVLRHKNSRADGLLRIFLVACSFDSQVVSEISQRRHREFVSVHKEYTSISHFASLHGLRNRRSFAKKGVHRGEVDCPM